MRCRVEKLVAGGMGLGRVAGRACFIPYAAPGDELEIAVVEEHGSWIEGRIVEIVEPAPCRVEPRCPVFGRCGGCQWQHLDYATQCEAKRAIVAEALERIGKVSAPDVLRTLASPKRWHYRNRIQLHVDREGRVGLYRPKSKEVVEFEECFIIDARLNDELTARREQFATRDRGVALRLDGEAGFAQVNTAQNEQMRRVLCEWLAAVPHETVLELYAGSGNLTFAVAPFAGRVVASDIDGRAIEAARARQAAGEGANIEFVRAEAGRAAKRFPEGVDLVIVDPPRKGCAEAVEAIIATRPRHILSLSCDPATHARDIRSFIEKGYRFVRALPIDMFPQTFHVETLALLERMENPS